MELMIWIFIVGCYGMQFVNSQGQRIAPGVPPQQYEQYAQHVPVQNMPMQHGQPQHVPMQQQVPMHQQQVPMQQQQVPMQQQQQVPMQQQQVPMQQQQVPMQQQHVPVHAQQQSHGHGHGHGHNHGQPQQVLNTGNIAHEKQHIQEHMEVPIDTSKMSEQELQFHYFKMHDADNNNKLDGCELIKSLIHWHEHGKKDPNTPGPEEKIFKDDELVALIDPILTMDDTNRDGFIDYPEFIQAQQKAAASAPKL